MSVTYLPNHKLIRLASNAGDGKGEQTLLAMSPDDAMRVAYHLDKVARENGGVLK